VNGVITRPLTDWQGNIWGSYKIWRNYNNALVMTFTLDGRPDRCVFKGELCEAIDTLLH
jgi:hypothetical protein